MDQEDRKQNMEEIMHGLLQALNGKHLLAHCSSQRGTKFLHSQYPNTGRQSFQNLSNSLPQFIKRFSQFVNYGKVSQFVVQFSSISRADLHLQLCYA